MILKSAPLLLLIFVCAGTAQAGIFNAPHFIEPGKMAIGVEPELTTSNGAGLAGNLKYSVGVTDFMDSAAIIGLGDGPLRFRLGFDLTFDIFPDVDRQPGIGLLTRAIYYRYPVSGELRILGAPYIHKAFTLDDKSVLEPYVAVPAGFGFDNGTYHGLGQLVLGSMYQNMEKFRYNFELGINLGNAETYISGGITYYP